MADRGYNKNITYEPHKRFKREMTIVAMSKKSRRKMSIADIIKLSNEMLKQNPTKQLMIKVLSDKGYFQLKAYNDTMSVIKTEAEYMLGREDSQKYLIFQATFYLL